MEVDSDDEDAECNSDLLQRLYQELRKFTALDDETNPTRPWPNGWYALLDIMRLVHGCSLEILDIWIQMLHWLVDNEGALSHEMLPKNARQLDRWRKKNFPDLSQFIGSSIPIMLPKGCVCVCMCVCVRGCQSARGEHSETGQTDVLHQPIDIYRLQFLDARADKHARVSNGCFNVEGWLGLSNKLGSELASLHVTRRMGSGEPWKVTGVHFSRICSVPSRDLGRGGSN